MLGFNFKIMYRLGCDNKAVGALSRNPNFSREINAILVRQMEKIRDIQ